MTMGALALGLAGVLIWRNTQRPLETSGGTPRLKVDKQTVDLGEVALGRTVSVAFELTNSGDGPLHFQEAPYVEVVEGC